MKKCIALILSCMMLLVCLTGCKEETPENASSVNTDGQVPAPTLHPDEVYSQLSNEKIAWGLKKVKAKSRRCPTLLLKRSTPLTVYICRKAAEKTFI